MIGLRIGWVAAVALFFAGCSRPDAEPVPIGILHSQTGTMAVSESAVLDATVLAIEQINAGGGLLGRSLSPVIADGASDPATFAREAERLIDDHRVAVIFGCWTSASRKAVVPVIESRNGLLFYPVQYEGLEASPNVVYTGATPNQQVMPAVGFALATFGPRVFLVGSDYVFPRTANAIIRDQVSALGGEVAGERYALLGAEDFSAIVGEIAERQPNVILNTINGDSNVAFFSELRARGITPEQIPTISFSIGETELAAMDPAKLAGDFAAWNYFASVETPENEAFRAAYRERFGADAVTSDPMEAAYAGVMLWAEAVREAGTFEPGAVSERIGGHGYHAPGGLVYVDPATRHLWKPVRIGRIRPDGQFDIVWSSPKAVRPVPFPTLRTRAAWERFLKSLFDGWGGTWSAPAHDES